MHEQLGHGRRGSQWINSSQLTWSKLVYRFSRAELSIQGYSWAVQLINIDGRLTALPQWLQTSVTGESRLLLA